MAGSACVSVDLDGVACYKAIHGELSGSAMASDDPILTTGVERMLDFFERHEVPATLFCIGNTLSEPRLHRLLEGAHEAGHELANHTQHHLYDLRTQRPDVIASEITDAEVAIAQISGRPPVGFRAPGYNIAAPISRVLERRGYRYDSSIFPSPSYWAAKGVVMGAMRVVGRKSRSQMTLPGTLTAPTRPYRCDPNRPWRRDGGGIWQLPIAVVPGTRAPVIGTTLHAMGRRGFASIEPVMRLANRKLFNLELHAIDFVDATDHPTLGALASVQPDLRIDISKKLATYRDVLKILGDHWTLRTLRDAVDVLDGVVRT